MGLSIDSALKHAATTLADCHFITRARLEAEILLGFVLEKERVWLHTNDGQKLDSSVQEQFLSLVTRRAQGCPIEYLTHRASFLDFELFVDSSVLIPRPESEILVQKVCEILSHDQRPHLTLIEVGVGSGALSIAIARALPHISIIATDISPEALKTAARNIEYFGLQERITLKHTTLFDTSDKADMVVSNPPYIASTYPIDKPLTYEPSSALFGGIMGSEILESLIAKCSAQKVPYLACEMGYDQRLHLAKVLESSRYNAQFYKDLAGLDRGFVARLQA